MRDDWRMHLLTEIAEGRSVREICRDDEGMPSRKHVYAEAQRDAAFGDQYARALEIRADVLFDQMLEIADTPVAGERAKIIDGKCVEVTRADMIEHRRLQVEARKWAIGRMNPKKYGDKLALGGADDLPAIKSEMSLDEAGRRLAFILTAPPKDE